MMRLCRASDTVRWAKLWRSFTAVALVSALNTSCTQDTQRRQQVFGEVAVAEIDVASRIAARVLKWHVQEGQKVQQGDLLVELEDDVLQARRERAEATILAAQSQSDIAEDAVRPEELAQLRADSAAKRKQHEFARATVARLQPLLAEGAIAQQQYDEAEFKAEAARQAYLAAQARVQMAEQGAREEQRAGARAMVEQARTGLAEVSAFDKDLRVAAPIDGEVFQILNHEGELVPAGYPLVTLLRMSQMWVTVTLPETELINFSMGQQVTIRFPALADQAVTGKVSFISSMASFATRSFTQDKSIFDLKTFEVRLSLDAMPEHLRPGMTAVVERR